MPLQRRDARRKGCSRRCAVDYVENRSGWCWCSAACRALSDARRAHAAPRPAARMCATNKRAAAREAYHRSHRTYQSKPLCLVTIFASGQPPPPSWRYATAEDARDARAQRPPPSGLLILDILIIFAIDYFHCFSAHAPLPLCCRLHHADILLSFHADFPAIFPSARVSLAARFPLKPVALHCFDTLVDDYCWYFDADAVHIVPIFFIPFSSLRFHSRNFRLSASIDSQYSIRHTYGWVSLFRSRRFTMLFAHDIDYIEIIAFAYFMCFFGITPAKHFFDMPGAFSCLFD